MGRHDRDGELREAEWRTEEAREAWRRARDELRKAARRSRDDRRRAPTERAAELY